MKTQTYNKPLGLLIVLAILGFMAQDAWSQNLVNGTGGIVKNAGVIRFVENAAEFQNANTTLGNTGGAYDAEFASPTSGTIEITGTTLLFNGAEPLGDDNAADANRISGWVNYAGAGAQTIQAKAYRNLLMSAAGTKSFGAITLYVDRIYDVASTSGNRDYGTSSFYYDGDVAATEDQDIFPEAGTAANDNAYANLLFLNSGVKTLQEGDEAFAYASIDLDATATNVTVYGHLSAKGSATVLTDAGSVMFIAGDHDGTIDMGVTDGMFSTNNGAGTLAGNIFLFDEGTYITQGTGLQTFTGIVTVGDDDAGVTYTATNSSASLTLVSGDATFDTDGELILAAAAGHIVAGTGRTLTFSGDGEFTNSVAWTTGTNERPNMEFHPLSTVDYAGNSATNDVVGAGYDYPYGNLVVSTGTDLEIEAGTEAHVYSDFTLSAANLLADADQDPDTDGGSSEALVMINPASLMNYTGIFEVVGAVERFTSGGSTTMTFNNVATKFGVTDVPASVSSVKLSVWKGEMNTAVGGAGDGNKANTDISRRLKIDVDESAPTWAGSLQMAYLRTETPGGSTVTDEYLNSLRFREYDPTPAGASEKVSTGQALIRHGAGGNTGTGLDQGAAAPNGFGYVTITGIETNILTPAIPDPGGSTIASSNELFLRGGPTWFITINPGRWSNPDTWDEAEQPGPNDLCLVRHTVWAGFVNQLDDFETNEDVWLATKGTDETELASYVAIFNDATYKGALLFGQSEQGTDNAATHMVDPQWGFKENGTDLTGWSVLGIDPAIVQGKLHIQAKTNGDAVAEVPDGTLELAHYPDGTDMPTYHGGLYVFGKSGTNTNVTQLTVPTILENNFIIKNYGLIILGE